jgi:small subunit ribosomal protein S5
MKQNFPQNNEGDGFETVVAIRRTTAVVKGGRRFSFGALVVVGDGSGHVGRGYGKAREVADAIRKGSSEARKAMVKIPMRGDTIPHEVSARYITSQVRLMPAGPGTGVIAGSAVRAVVANAGIKNILTKVHGSTNPVNVVRATFLALSKLRTKDEVERLRGVKI